jgi:uncharacterized membrane protein YtjA (UPF0391 family)
MLFWALIFLVVAIISGYLGFTTLAGVAAFIAQALFVVFLIGFIVILVFGTWLASRIFGRR